MRKKKNHIRKVELDAYEKEIENMLPDFSSASLCSKNQKEEISHAKAAAADYLRKNAKINIRISHYDLEGLRRLAVREGLPYQTLISSILHKYVISHLQIKE